MKRTRYFPDLSGAQTTAAEQRVELNGQEVAFEKVVTLLPVKLEPKLPEDEDERSGTFRR